MRREVKEAVTGHSYRLGSDGLVEGLPSLDCVWIRLGGKVTDFSPSQLRIIADLKEHPDEEVPQ